jgi:hypothetical protein
MQRPMMQEAQTRFTFSRSWGDKWMVHVDGTRKPGMITVEVLEMVADILGEPEGLRTILLERKEHE